MIYVPSGAPPRRHLLYHVWPVRDSLWRWNLRHLLTRIDVFNGRRVVAIVHDARSEPPEAVEELLDGHGCEFIVTPNGPAAEALTFPSLLSRLAQEDPTGIAFYGHAKGVKYGDRAPRAVRLWARSQYVTCLDDWLTVREHLGSAGFTGPLRRLGRFREHQQLGSWHYSGTFFWMRLERALAPRARHVPHFYGGVEAWPGLHFESEDARCLFFDELDASPYDERFWRERGLPELLAWQARVRRVQPPSDLLSPAPVDGVSGPRTEQKPAELLWWIDQLAACGARSLLVIGSLHGGVEWHVARIFRARGLDLTLTSLDLHVSPNLLSTLQDARAAFGQDACAVQGDSASPEVRGRLAPTYDAVFIDAAHGYRAVHQDFLLARALGARLIGFHDIVDSDWHVQARCCVSRLWEELRARHWTMERTSGAWGGVGILRCA